MEGCAQGVSRLFTNQVILTGVRQAKLETQNREEEDHGRLGCPKGWWTNLGNSQPTCKVTF